MSTGYIVRRGGGDNLNFKVIGQTTQPTGVENLIWVNTSVAITGWVFSSTQPTNSTAGTVWFNTATSSTAAFNALKKNGIWVYPTVCQQYISGAWVSKTAMTYQNGAWVEWGLYLYNYGVVETAVSGGLSNTGYTYSGVSTAPTFESDHITLGVDAIAGTSNKINVNEYTVLKAVIRPTSSMAAHPWLGLSASKTISGSSALAARVSPTTPYEDNLVQIDLTELSGDYYALTAVSTSGASGNVYKIWFE